MSPTLKFLAIVLGVAGIAAAQVFHVYKPEFDPTLVIGTISSLLGGLGVHAAITSQNPSSAQPTGETK